jgi:hypothetical protein
MDFVGFPDNAIFYGIGLELMIDNPRDYMETWAPARLTRCTITKATEAVTCEILADENFGLPAFNIEHYQKKPYNYACVVAPSRAAGRRRPLAQVLSRRLSALEPITLACLAFMRERRR